MTPTQSTELTIRAARLIKAASALVGVKDGLIASLIVSEVVGEFKELADFTATLRQSEKPHG